MPKDVYVNAKCRVISSVRGPEGTSVGRIVRAAALNEIPHQVWGNMWDCEPLDGRPFDARVAAPDGSGEVIKPMATATFAEDWLEVIEDDELPPKAVTKEHELTQ